jgi:hypothetical protein
MRWENSAVFCARCGKSIHFSDPDVVQLAVVSGPPPGRLDQWGRQVGPWRATAACPECARLLGRVLSGCLLPQPRDGGGEAAAQPGPVAAEPAPVAAEPAPVASRNSEGRAEPAPVAAEPARAAAKRSRAAAEPTGAAARRGRARAGPRRVETAEHGGGVVV